jgi:hypothetical protein
MSQIEPLPFLLRYPRQDTLDSRGARSIRYRVDGLLHLDVALLTVEWAEVQEIQRVSLTGIGTDLHALSRDAVEVPLSLISEVRLRGWWAPRLELRGRRLDAFDGIPGARPGALTLRIPRRYRAVAATFAAALERARTAAELVDSTPAG